MLIDILISKNIKMFHKKHFQNAPPPPPPAPPSILNVFYNIFMFLLINMSINIYAYLCILVAPHHKAKINIFL